MVARPASAVYNAVRFVRGGGATGLRAGLCLLGTLEASPQHISQQGQSHFTLLEYSTVAIDLHMVIRSLFHCLRAMAASASRRAPMPVPTSRVGSPPVDLSSGVSSGARLQQHCKRGGAAGPPWCGC